MRSLEAPALADIRGARERIRGIAIRTPLIRLNVEAPADIWLKCENLQPIGCFKLRGAGNAMAMAPPASLAEGVYTASAGNMAQGVAYCARRLGIPCSVVVPDHAPGTKVAAIERLGASIVKVPFDTWWRVMMEHRYDGMRGHFVHPVSDPRVIAGNGTIGLEILEDLPEVDVILVPYGGGGLSSGIAAAVGAPDSRVRVMACEVATAAPFTPSLAAGHPVAVSYTPTFVDGIGAKGILEEMWPLVSRLLAGGIVVAPEEAAAAVRLVAERNRMIVEGAAGVAVAAALAGKAGAGTIVCVLSGGNIDAKKIAAILSGEVP